MWGFESVCLDIFFDFPLGAGDFFSDIFDVRRLRSEHFFDVSMLRSEQSRGFSTSGGFGAGIFEPLLMSGGFAAGGAQRPSYKRAKRSSQNFCTEIPMPGGGSQDP